jgi:hypothetical protein
MHRLAIATTLSTLRSPKVSANRDQRATLALVSSCPKSTREVVKASKFYSNNRTIASREQLKSSATLALKAGISFL